MILRSYLHNEPPCLDEIIVAPIHLADYNERHYYVFAEDSMPPLGGEAVSDEQLKDVLQVSLLFKQIKREAQLRILAVAALWQQQNALADLLLLKGRDDLTEAEQEKLTKAQDLLKRIEQLRQRSNEIEASFLKGTQVDYLTNKAWEI